jgi:hypothetical protein
MSARMNVGFTARTPAQIGLQVVIAGLLAATGYLHARLYINGYRFIHVIGPLFLIQAAAALALALLVLIGAPAAIRIVAAGTAAGALVGFVLSRTVGVFGFTEHGWQPSPDALLSVLVEVAAVLLLLPTVVGFLWQVRLSGRQDQRIPVIRS